MSRRFELRFPGSMKSTIVKQMSFWSTSGKPCPIRLLEFKFNHGAICEHVHVLNLFTCTRMPSHLIPRQKSFKLHSGFFRRLFTSYTVIWGSQGCRESPTGTKSDTDLPEHWLTLFWMSFSPQSWIWESLNCFSQNG